MQCRLSAVLVQCRTSRRFALVEPAVVRLSVRSFLRAPVTGARPMRQFMISGAHKTAMTFLLEWCDEASVAHWDRPENSSFLDSSGSTYAKAAVLKSKHRPRSRDTGRKRNFGGFRRGSRVRCAGKFLRSEEPFSASRQPRVPNSTYNDGRTYPQVLMQMDCFGLKSACLAMLIFRATQLSVGGICA